MRTPRAFVQSPLLIDLSFEQANGETFVRDAGNGGAAWTLSGGATQQTGTVLAGSASLECAWGTSGVCTTPYGRNIALGPNDDFELEFQVRCTDWNLGGAGKNFFMVGGTVVVGDTVLILSTNASNNFSFSVSNGSSFNSLASSGGEATDNSTMTLAAGRRGSFTYIRKNGAVIASASGTFTGRILQNPSALFRIGHPGTAQTGAPTLQYDNFKFWRYDRGQRHFLQRHG